MEKSLVVSIFKDVEETYNRLFNHRGVISGEIKYFLKEFEDQRKDREVERLFQLLETTTDIKETQIDRFKSSADVHLSSIAADLEAATSLCTEIVENPLESEVEYLRVCREIREKEWEEFQKDMAKKRDMIEESFAEQKGDLEKYYQVIEASFKKV